MHQCSWNHQSQKLGRAQFIYGAEKSDGASSHLPGLDLVLVVILKDAFIAQTQPPRDPLLVLKQTTKILQEKVCMADCRSIVNKNVCGACVKKRKEK